MTTAQAYPLWRNWNRNLLVRPRTLARPRTTAEVATLVSAAARAGQRVRPVGAGYSYTPLVQTDDVMVSVDALAGVQAVDWHTHTVEAGAGTRLADLVDALARQQAALANLGDIDRQTVAGAIATGTHGTGLTLGCLSAQVREVTLVDGRGEVHTLTRESAPGLFGPACVSLGALGIVTSVRLAVQPRHALVVERRTTTFDRVLAGLSTAVAEHRNFEFFWFPGHGSAYTKAMNVAGGDAPRARVVDGVTRFANDVLIENGLVWLAAEMVRRRPGLREPWLDLGTRVVPDQTVVVPSHRAYATPRLVRHHEIEYAMPFDRAVDVLTTLDALLERHPVKTVIPVEVRFTAADDLPLSMSHGRPVVYVAVHAYRREDFGELFDICEDVFQRFEGRPHWGKLHSLQAAQLRERYPRWDAFQRARATLDPDGVFANGFLRRVLGPAAAHPAPAPGA